MNLSRAVSMKRAMRILITAAAVCAFGGSGYADIILDDPLHGYCSAGCVDNGTNTPIASNPPVGWGFTASPGPQTGTLTVDILIPNNISGAGPFTITGAATGTATLFSSTSWTSGFLDAYLGISASPENPIGAYLPSTQGFQPSATGFFVFQATLGSLTLPGPGGTPPLFNLSQLVPVGSYIVGFLSTASGIFATANSGALFAVPGPAVGAGIPGLIAACLALLALGRRRQQLLA